MTTLDISQQKRTSIILSKDIRVRKLLFAFVSDNDMVVNAVDLIKLLKCKAIYPQNFHRSLATD